MSETQTYWQRALRRRLSRRQAMRLAAFGGISAFTAGSLLACGSREQGGESPAIIGPGPQDTTADARPGGIYRTVMIQDPPSLDPALSTSGFPSQYIGGAAYSRLLKWATGPGVQPLTETVGDAAQSVESPDGQVWVFRLRPNMKFHPKPPLNGRLLDAEDVKASVDRFLARSPNRAIIQSLVDRVEVVDQLTVRFILKQRYVPFNELVAAPFYLWILSKEAAAGQIDPQKPEGVIGTGPWMLERVQPSVAYEYRKNPEWYEVVQTKSGPQRLPFLDGVVVSVIPEYAQQVSQFLAGNIHGWGDNPTLQAATNQDVPEIVSRVPQAQRQAVVPTWNMTLFFFNLDEPNNPFRDARLRRALSMAIDRDGIIETFGQVSRLKQQGLEVPTGWHSSPIGWGEGALFWWLDPRSADMGSAGQWYRYDPAESRRMLNAAGYTGQEVTLNFAVGFFGQEFDLITEALISMLRAAGFNIRPNPQDYRTQYVEGTFRGNFSGIAFGPQSLFTSVDEWVFGMLHPNGIRWVMSRPRDQQLVSLVEAQRVEADRNRRRALIQEIQRLASDQMYYVPSTRNGWARLAFYQDFVRNWGSFITAGYGFMTETWTRYWLDLPQTATG